MKNTTHELKECFEMMDLPIDEESFNELEEYLNQPVTDYIEQGTDEKET